MPVVRTSRNYLRASIRVIRVFVGKRSHFRVGPGTSVVRQSHDEETNAETFVHHGTRSAFRGLFRSKLDEVRL
jgi:hypothetical protein